jgi:hypothetical protein
VPEVRLLVYGDLADVVAVDNLTGIIELPIGEDGVSRYVRIDDRDEVGRPVYGIIGTEHSPAIACPTCRDVFEARSHKLTEELAVDEERHAFLVRCEDCRELYEVVPEDRRPAEALTVQAARTRFPGAI